MLIFALNVSLHFPELSIFLWAFFVFLLDKLVGVDIVVE